MRGTFNKGTRSRNSSNPSRLTAAERASVNQNARIARMGAGIRPLRRRAASAGAGRSSGS